MADWKPFSPSEPPAGRPVKVIAVTGGKGGVGKTTVSANLAVALAERGRDVMVLDADLGLGTLGSVANVGGVGRLAYVIGRERARSERVLHLDSGDCFQGAPIFNFYSGEPEVRSLSAMGIDAAVVGGVDSLCLTTL